MMMRVMVMAPMMCFGGIIMALYKDADAVAYHYRHRAAACA